MSTIFSLSFLLVAPFWFLMIALPNHRWTKRIIASPWIIAPAALLYIALLLPGIGQAMQLLAAPTLENIAPMLGTPEGATLGWVHFLAFDLFTGRWAYLDNQKSAINRWLMALLLFMIFMVGPLGLLAYLGVRAARNRPLTNQNPTGT